MLDASIATTAAPPIDVKVLYAKIGQLTLESDCEEALSVG